MEQNILEIRIAVVAMSTPAGGSQINFNVPGTGCLAANLQNGAPKIRPTFNTDKAGMKNTDTFSVGGL